MARMFCWGMTFLVFTAIWVLLPGSLLADKVTLKDERSFETTVLKKTDEYLEVKRDGASMLYLPEEVEKIELSKSEHAQEHGHKKLIGKEHGGKQPDDKKLIGKEHGGKQPDDKKLAGKEHGGKAKRAGSSVQPKIQEFVGKGNRPKRNKVREHGGKEHGGR